MKSCSCPASFVFYKWLNKVRTASSLYLHCLDKFSRQVDETLFSLLFSLNTRTSLPATLDTWQDFSCYSKSCKNIFGSVGTLMWTSCKPRDLCMKSCSHMSGHLCKAARNKIRNNPHATIIITCFVVLQLTQAYIFFSFAHQEPI